MSFGEQRAECFVKQRVWRKEERKSMLTFWDFMVFCIHLSKIATHCNQYMFYLYKIKNGYKVNSKCLEIHQFTVRKIIYNRNYNWDCIYSTNGRPVKLNPTSGPISEAKSCIWCTVAITILSNQTWLTVFFHGINITFPMLIFFTWLEKLGIIVATLNIYYFKNEYNITILNEVDDTYCGPCWILTSL